MAAEVALKEWSEYINLIGNGPASGGAMGYRL